MKKTKNEVKKLKRIDGYYILDALDKETEKHLLDVDTKLANYLLIDFIGELPYKVLDKDYPEEELKNLERKLKELLKTKEQQELLDYWSNFQINYTIGIMKRAIIYGMFIKSKFQEHNVELVDKITNEIQ